MKIAGIDPSSTCSGIALLRDTELIDTWVWRPNKRESSPNNLLAYFRWLSKLLRPDAFQDPIADMAAIESLSVTRNAQTVRKIAHYQAASVLACKVSNVIVVEGRVSSARSIALGNGGMGKEEAWKVVRKMYPDHKFERVDNGGMDEADAIVMALACPGLAEI